MLNLFSTQARKYATAMLLVCLLLLPFTAYSQSEFKLQDWQSYSSLLNAHVGEVADDGTVWVGTDGGVFSYRPETEDFRAYRNINELLSLNVTALSISPQSGKVYVGSKAGSLDIIDPKTGKIINLTDIAVFDAPALQINDIIFHESRAFLACGFGLAVLNTEDNTFEVSIKKIGKLLANTEITDIEIFDNRIYLATGNVIAHASLDSLLQNPDSWSYFAPVSGFPKSAISHIEFFKEDLFASSDNILFKIDGEAFLPVDTLDMAIHSISSDGEHIYFTSLYEFYRYPGGYVYNLSENTLMNASRFAGEPGRFLFLLQNGGIAFYDVNGAADNLDIFRPNSPLTNTFDYLKIDTRGDLWVNGGTQNAFSVLHDNKWLGFSSSLYPDLPSNSFNFTEELSSGSMILSSYGEGFITIDSYESELEFTHYNHTNSPMIGLADAQEFIVCGEARTDYLGRTWLPILGRSSSGPLLIMIDKSGILRAYDNLISPTYREFYRTAVDFSGTVWLASWTEATSPRGLYYFNNSNTPDNNSDDRAGFISTASNPNLIANSQTCLAIDQLGLIWIGTDKGLNVIINPSAVLSGNEPFIRSIDFLSNEYINDIMIDALNNKWIATNKGVWVLDEEANGIISVITSSNSKLPTNKVLSLESDFKTGKVYFGTREGLFSAFSLSVQPLSSYDINCYPQPFDPSVHDEMVIEGLAPQSEVRILTINGELITSIKTNSSKTVWDGKDKDGKTVGNGVYLVVAASENTSNSGVQKIAVIKK